MIFEASASLNDFPWLLVPSGGVVALTLLAFGLPGHSPCATSTSSRAASASASPSLAR